MYKHSKDSARISDDLKQKIIEFFTENSVESFKESYYNKNVKDGTVVSFVLKVNDTKKEIFVSNYYIKEFGELVKIINKNIPPDYKISYTENCCNETIEK